MNKLINRIRQELTNYSFETKAWSFVMMLMIVSIVLSSCSTHKVLDGLCYSESTGTYMCNEDKSPYENEEQDMGEFQDFYDKCKKYEDNKDTWVECIMDRIDINTTTSGNTTTNTYQPITIWSSVGT